MNNNEEIFRDLLIDAELQRAELTERKKTKTSDRLKLGINKVLKENGEPSYYAFFKIKRNRILTVIAAVVLLFTLCMSVTAVRETLLGFFINTFEDHSIVYVDKGNKDRPKTVTEFYRPSYVPEGYEIKSENHSRMGYDIFWENGEINYIYYSQSTYYGEFGFDAAESTEIRYINEDLILNIYRSERSVRVFWRDDKYVYIISSMKTLCEDELINMALSLQKAEFTENS